MQFKKQRKSKSKIDKPDFQAQNRQFTGLPFRIQEFAKELNKNRKENVQKYKCLTNLSKNQLYQLEDSSIELNSIQKMCEKSFTTSNLKLLCHAFFLVLDSISYRPRIFRTLTVQLFAFRLFFNKVALPKTLFFIFRVRSFRFFLRSTSCLAVPFIPSM